MTTTADSVELTTFPDESVVFESVVVVVWVFPPAMVLFATCSLVSVELTALPSASLETSVVVVTEPLPLAWVLTVFSEEPVTFPSASLDLSTTLFPDSVFVSSISFMPVMFPSLSWEVSMVEDFVPPEIFSVVASDFVVPVTFPFASFAVDSLLETVVPSLFVWVVVD